MLGLSYSELAIADGENLGRVGLGMGTVHFLSVIMLSEDGPEGRWTREVFLPFSENSNWTGLVLQKGVFLMRHCRAKEKP